MIKIAQRQKRPSLPSKRPGGLIYESIKYASKNLGVYKQEYDPGYYMEKYTYKPRKRVAGYLGQKLHAKKVRKTYYQYRKTYCGKTGYTNFNKFGITRC